MKKYYAGIGSRTTPNSVEPKIREIAEFLISEGYILRSGGADGADTMFENAVKDKSLKEIYVPWYCFNSSTSPLCRVSEEAIQFSLKYHPKPEGMTRNIQKIMGRNAYQVLGQDLKTKSDFIVCWQKENEDAVPLWNHGGTSQALRIAEAHGIKFYNIATEKISFKDWYCRNNFDIM